jgi:hypothetical protein
MRLWTLGSGGEASAKGCKPRQARFFSSERSERSEDSGCGGISYVGPTPAAWHNDDELDVRFWLDAPALASGQRSNLGAQLEAMRLGLPRVETSFGDPEGPMIERLGHAEREARIHRRMAALGHGHADVLAAAFGAEQLPREVRVRFGDLLGPVVLLLEQRGELRRDDDDAGEQAEQALREAMEAYLRAKAAS